MSGESGEVQLRQHIPVHVTYFTARVDDNGKLRTYGDFYGLDDRSVPLCSGGKFGSRRRDTTTK